MVLRSFVIALVGKLGRVVLGGIVAEIARD